MCCYPALGQRPVLPYATEWLCAQASGNVAGLCSWAEAMCTYHEVAKEVEPKIQALSLAEGELRAASRERDAALEQLSIVQGSLDAMQARA